MHGGTRIRRLEPFLGRLYQCARADGYRVFHSLHDKLCSMKILAEAWKRVASNNGAAGIDNETIEDIRNSGADLYLSALQQELMDGTYTVECVRRVYIPKPNGKQRPLGIPTVGDRIVKQAVKLLIEPIFEADFQDCSYGYRRGSSAKKFREMVRDIISLTRSHVKSEEQAVNELNPLITDRTGYFNHSNASRVYSKMDQYVAWKAAKFYYKIHKIRAVSSNNGTKQKMYATGLMHLGGRIHYVR